MKNIKLDTTYLSKRRGIDVDGDVFKDGERDEFGALDIFSHPDDGN